MRVFHEKQPLPGSAGRSRPEAPRRPALALFLVALLGLLVSPQGASRSAPVEVGISPDASSYKGRPVSSVKVKGVSRRLASLIEGGVEVAARTGTIFKKGAPLDVDVLGTDLERTRLLLARKGYPDAKVGVTVRPRTRAGSVQVTFTIDPGKPVKVARVTTTGFPPQVKTSSAIQIGAGDTYDEDKMQLSMTNLVNELKREGYAEADVRTRVEAVDSSRVALRFEAEPGVIHYFRDVSITGVGSRIETIVRRSVDVKHGQRYSPGRLERTQERLQLLNLFSQTRITPRMIEPDSVDVQVQLSLSPPQVVQTGAGYYTDDHLRAHASWTDRNLAGTGRWLKISSAYSRFDQTFSIGVGWPNFGEQFRGQTQASVDRQVEDSYNLIDTELDLSETYTPALNLSVQAGAAVSDVQVHIKSPDAAAFESKSGLLSYLFLHWNRNTTDNPLDPHRGFVTNVSSEWAPDVFLTDNHYILGDATGSGYFRVYRGIVLASRLEVGAAKPTGSSPDLLPNKRFYAGGVKSMRGFHRRQLGPLDADGNPIGGQFLLLASVEARIPLFWRFRTALFLDTGQVWRQYRGVKPKQMEVAAGPGIMVQTPVGPIRLDYAHRLTHFEQHQPGNVLQLSIGEPF